MKTEQLIEMLARGPIAVDPQPVRRRYWQAMLGGTGAALLLMALLLGVRPDLISALEDPMFWVKLGFVSIIAAFSLPANRRLGSPGASLGRLGWGVAAPILLIWLLAALVLIRAPAESRSVLIMGATWSVCPLNITLLAMPSFLLLTWAMRGLAPTRPRLAGAAVGLLSGAIGAIAYSLHCPEMAAPFLAIWYVAGIVVPTIVGALLGPRLLRW